MPFFRSTCYHAWEANAEPTEPAMSDKPLSADRPSLLRRLRVPLIAFTLPVLLFIAVSVYGRMDLADSVPEAMMPLVMAAMVSTELAILVVAVWFLFFSGLRLSTKVIGVLVVVAVVTAVYKIPRRWEFGGMMSPIPVFRWQPDIQAELDERLAHPVDHTGTLSAADFVVDATDFPRYRGARADGVAPEAAIATDWTATPPKEVWRTPVGWAYSGIAVAGNVAVTLEQRGEKEAVVCYDRASGKELWAYAYDAHFKQSAPMGGDGPRSTPTISGGDVYTLGAEGHLVCLDGTTGKPRWPVVDVIKDNGAAVVKWGMTSSPLVVGKLVVVNAGIDPANNQHQAVAAYDRTTGKKVWAVGDYAAGYSSPMLATLDGMEQIVLFDAGGVAGIDPADGKELWRHPWTTFNDMNIIQPLILPGDRVFISSELTNGCALLEVKKSGSTWTVRPAWTSRALAARFANPVYCDGHIYGLSNNRLCCLSAATGKRQWRSDEEFESGQLLLCGKTLLVQPERSGEVLAVSADPKEYRELGRTKVFRGSRTWNTPALAGGRLYLRNHEEMVCLELAK
jgi:outer membrane protein assembly factor BamB